MANKKIISAGTGRRKTAVARVTLVEGDGKWIVNRKPLEEYITSEALRDYLKQPIAISGYDLATTDVLVFAKGGGISGQAGAIRHGLARAIEAAGAEITVQASSGAPERRESEYRAALKKAGCLTRDSRMKERKKPGQPGARKRFQFSKR